MELEVIETKKGVLELIDNIINDIQEGNTDVVDAYSVFTIIDKKLSEAKDKLKENMVDLVERNGKFVKNGIEFSTKETGVKYDYSASTTWNDYQIQIDEFKSKQKKIEAQLKAATPETPYIDPRTGDIIDGIAKQSTTSLITKIL